MALSQSYIAARRAEALARRSPKVRASKEERAETKAKRKERKKRVRAHVKAWKTEKRSKRKSDKKFRRTDVSKANVSERKAMKKLTKNWSVFMTHGPGALERMKKAGWRNDAAKAATTAYKAKEAKRKGIL